MSQLWLFDTVSVEDSTVYVQSNLAKRMYTPPNQTPDCQDGCGTTEPGPLGYAVIDANWSIDVPQDGLTVIYGDTFWSGNISRGETKIMRTQIRPERRGFWKITVSSYTGTPVNSSDRSMSFQHSYSFLYDGNEILLNPHCESGTFDETSLLCVPRAKQIGEGEPVSDNNPEGGTAPPTSVYP